MKMIMIMLITTPVLLIIMGGIGVEELSDRVQGAFDRFCSSASGSKFSPREQEPPTTTPNN